MFQKTSPRVQQNIKPKIKFDIKIILLQIDPNHLKTLWKFSFESLLNYYTLPTINSILKFYRKSPFFSDRNKNLIL